MAAGPPGGVAAGGSPISAVPARAPGVELFPTAGGNRPVLAGGGPGLHPSPSFASGGAAMMPGTFTVENETDCVVELLIHGGAPSPGGGAIGHRSLRIDARGTYSVPLENAVHGVVSAAFVEEAPGQQQPGVPSYRIFYRGRAVEVGSKLLVMQRHFTTLAADIVQASSLEEALGKGQLQHEDRPVQIFMDWNAAAGGASGGGMGGVVGALPPGSPAPARCPQGGLPVGGSPSHPVLPGSPPNQGPSSLMPHRGQPQPQQLVGSPSTLAYSPEGLPSALVPPPFPQGSAGTPTPAPTPGGAAVGVARVTGVDGGVAPPAAPLGEGGLLAPPQGWHAPNACVQVFSQTHGRWFEDAEIIGVAVQPAMYQGHLLPPGSLFVVFNGRTCQKGIPPEAFTKVLR